MRITVIGQSSCIPDVGKEVACLLIDGKHLIDTGWCAVLKMREFGFDPLDLETVIITHFHQDHYIGLAQLLFYIGLRGKADRPPFTIAGPAEHLWRVVNAAEEFKQPERFPELVVNKNLVPLKPGQSFTCGTYRVETAASRHESGHHRLEQAIAYKFFGKDNTACFAYTGDTHPHPPLAEFAAGVPLLIHDGAHTPPADAARVARDAGVGRLLLIHSNDAGAEDKQAAARAVFPATDLAREGDTIDIPG